MSSDQVRQGSVNAHQLYVEQTTRYIASLEAKVDDLEHQCRMLRDDLETARARADKPPTHIRSHSRDAERPPGG